MRTYEEGAMGRIPAPPALEGRRGSDRSLGLAATHEPVAEGWGPAEPPSSLDRLLHAAMGRLTLGISPVSLMLAMTDWALHLAESPAKRLQLLEKALRKEARLAHYLLCLARGHNEPCVQPLAQDRRFVSPAWQQWPFNLIHQSFLLNQQWWHNATTGIGGVSRHHEQVVSFAARQLLDMVSPVNFIGSNPDVLAATVSSGGGNLWKGALNWLEDWQREQAGQPPEGVEAYRPGHEVAVSKGKVIFRNRLIELIQYSPQTAKVYADPLLFVPAWIMKYYILDLSPGNSLVSYLVRRGYTVFMISWNNPGAEDSALGMDDYLHQGVLEAIRVVRKVRPQRQINAVGYCLGGTLLSIAASYLAKCDEAVLRSITLLAAQTDFREAGELKLFVDDSQINYLEDIMWHQGYLDNRQMAGAFQLLRSHDLIWSVLVNHYLMGERQPMTDLMAWNADPTRLPYRMHSEYLRHFFLYNDLFEGRYLVDGKPIALSDIRAPLFVVTTERDHVAPWRSVYKINLMADADVTFLLTSGGHNAGIISEPGHHGRSFRMSHMVSGERYLDPDSWYLAARQSEGSWWPVWSDWLAERSGGQVEAPAAPGSEQYPPLADAPGAYVLKR